MINISIYDDHKLRRDSLEALLSLTSTYHLAGSFAHCMNILEDTRRLNPDLILMDIEMPGMDGIEGMRLLKQVYPEVKVVIQTAFEDDEKIFKAMQAGAEGYILKTATIQQITQSIDDVMQGGAGMSPSIALKVMRYFNKQSASPGYQLTDKETAILKELAQGLSYKMIADKIGISYFTVNNHIKRIYEKLQVHSLGEAVAIAHKERLV
jgi:DNA-binding NarL/FixJ family response regulator